MKIENLLCEYFSNPLGIDTPRPRLSWQLESAEPGAAQTAYQVVCRSGGALLWDSGKVRSSASTHVEYAGKALVSGQRVTWKVRVWNQRGKPTAYSAPAWWEMGLLHKTDWHARWIGSSVVGGPQTTTPVPFLAKPFAISRRVERARLYITALGLYEASINGRLVTEDVFTPGWPDFRGRTLYQSYDVTQLLRAGDNVIGVMLADGWYCGHLSLFGRQFYGKQPKLLCQLVLTYADGSAGMIVSDDTWKTRTGPILESDIYMGESYDARLELPGWNVPGADYSQWNAVVTFDDPGLALVGRQSEPVRRIQELVPKLVAAPTKKSYLFDLGQNFTGRVRLRVKGPAGTTVTLRHGEMLKADGTLYTENLREARSTDYYTLKGGGEEVYEPRFTFHGFRYVELKGFPGVPDENTVTGIVIHTDMPPTGTFECSDPLVNQLQSNIQWGQKSNFLDIPTDCPQRNERLGWTGDAQAFIRTAAFNMGVAPFFTKWLADALYSQAPDGGIPSCIPSLSKIETDGGPGWADAFIICPWTVHLCYGDTRLLETLYDPLKRFVDSLVKPSVKGIRANPFWHPTFEGYGDWLALDGSADSYGATPKQLIGTAYLAHDLNLMSRIARALKKDKEADRYARLREQVKQAFNRRFVTRDGLLVAQTQTAHVLALHFDLLPESLRPAVADALVSDIKKRGWHLSTGFIGTPYLLHALSSCGKLDAAYQLLLQKTCPSWLYPVTQGATTIWERWDSWTHDKGFGEVGMNSFNHYAYGAVGDWLYQVVAGIELDPDRPGYKHIVFRPQPGGGLTFAKAAYRSLYGLVKSEWRIRKNRFEWTVVVPPNTSATLFLPGAKRGKVVKAGRHRLSMNWATKRGA